MKLWGVGLNIVCPSVKVYLLRAIGARVSNYNDALGNIWY